MQIDKKLLEDCLLHKNLAYSQLYKELFSYLMNICIRYKNDYDTAGASLNAIFLKVLNNLHEFRKEELFIPWIKRIAINHLIDEYRKEKREKEKFRFIEDIEHVDSLVSYHEKEAEMESEYLLEMIRELPPMTSRVFNLYAIDGYKHREIAEILEISESTSKWHLSDARKKLKLRLEVFNETTFYGR